MKISNSSIKFMFYATWAMMTFRSILEGIPSVTLNLKFLTLVSMLFVLIILSHQKYTIIEFFKIMFICFVGLIISIKTPLTISGGLCYVKGNAGIGRMWREDYPT